tara:strand:- start:1735 stop:2307 length:573 start_codon:yes stop_codon:yes gene_type:complete
MKRLSRLGNKGKEGTVYLVTNKGKEYAMKTFRKNKSSTKLKLEAKLQRMAAEKGISPNVIAVNVNNKYILMEKLDTTLHDLLIKKRGILSEVIQRQIICLYNKLDKTGVFHGDASILNFMFKNKKLYLIDFGMSVEITGALVKKLGTKTPNLDIMTLGLVLKFKELGIPEQSYKYLVACLRQEQRDHFNL